MSSIVFGIAYNTIYDTLYYALTAASIMLLAYTIFLVYKKRQGPAKLTQRNQAVGIALAACGFAVTIFAGVFLDAITKRGIIGDLLYQQLHFPIFYVGSAMILFGIDSSLLTVQKSFYAIAKNPLVKKLRILLWGVFTATVAISLFYLFTIRVGPTQHVAQQPIFFLPILFVVLTGVIGLPILAIFSKYGSLRRHLAWFSLSMLLILVGALREATIIPSSGEPIIDLIAAFAPFTAASFCLYLSIRSLYSKSD